LRATERRASLGSAGLALVRKNGKSCHELGRDHVIIVDEPAGFFQKVLAICLPPQWRMAPGIGWACGSAFCEMSGDIDSIDQNQSAINLTPM